MKGKSKQAFALLALSVLFIAFGYIALTKKDPIYIFVAIMLGIEVILVTLQTIDIMKRKKGIKPKRDINYAAFIIFNFIILLFGVCLIGFIKSVARIPNSKKTDATIYDIEEKIVETEERNEDGYLETKYEKKCDLYIEYNVNNIEYKAVLTSKNCKYSAGEEMTIRYDKDDPNTVIEDSPILLLVATIFAGTIAVVFVVKLRKESKPKKN